MKKISTKGYAILGILFVLVSAIAITVPTIKATTFWITYAFTVIAFAAQIIVWKYALGYGTPLKSKFLGFPVVYISVVYLVLQVIALVVFLLIPTLAPWITIVACGIIAGISAVCMISADVGRDEIEQVSAKAQKKVFYIRELQTEVELLADAETDATTEAALRQLAEKIRFSDPMSNAELADLENLLKDKICGLKTSADRPELINQLNSLLDERNKKCKDIKE